MSSDRLRRWLQPSSLKQYLLNEFVSAIPILAIRMRAYRWLGVNVPNYSSVTIMMRSEIWAASRLRVGSGATIGRHCLIDARGNVAIGANVNISSYCRIQSAKHLVNDPDFAHQYAPVTIGDRAWLGMGATILGGVTVGEGAVVAAGAVVTKDVPPYTIVGGIPAQKIGERNTALTYAIAYRPNWI